MMAENDLAGMLSSVLSNPEAMGMLTNLLSGVGGEGTEEAQPTADRADEAQEAGLLHKGSKHKRHRRELLCAVRPYLSTRRCATLDRMLRALELYEVIEQTELLKGRR